MNSKIAFMGVAVAALLLGYGARPVQAVPFSPDDWAAALERQIAILDHKLTEEGSAPVESPGSGPVFPDERWYLRNFWFRLRAKAGFEMPGFTQLAVVPEIELLWQRPNPTGWATYRP